MLANKYVFIENIGLGAFGTIFKGQHRKTGEYVAIKVEPIHSETRLLKNETKVYQYLRDKKCVGIPHVKWYGCDSVNFYMVVDLLGESLEARRKRLGPFSIEDTLKYGKQMVERLKCLHSCGLVHRDVKPDNFLFGNFKELDKKEEEILYLIDFGFCKQIDTSKNNEKKMNSIIGTPNYVSINVHNYNAPNQKDDLESIIYIMCFLYYESLPWNQAGLTNAQIKDIKIKLLSNIPKEFRNLMDL